MPRPGWLRRRGDDGGDATDAAIEHLRRIASESPRVAQALRNLIEAIANPRERPSYYDEDSFDSRVTRLKEQARARGQGTGDEDFDTMLATVYARTGITPLPPGPNAMTREQREADKRELEKEHAFLAEVLTKAKSVGVDAKTVRALMKGGELPQVRTRRGIAVKRADLEAWLRSKVPAP